MATKTAPVKHANLLKEIDPTLGNNLNFVRTRGTTTNNTNLEAPVQEYTGPSHMYCKLQAKHGVEYKAAQQAYNQLSEKEVEKICDQYDEYLEDFKERCNAFQYQKMGQQPPKAAKQLPPKPKQITTVYFRWLTDNRAALEPQYQKYKEERAAQKIYSYQNIGKWLSVYYQDEVAQSVKDKYQKEYDAEKKVWQKEMDTWNNKYNPKEKKSVKKSRSKSVKKTGAKAADGKKKEGKKDKKDKKEDTRSKSVKDKKQK